VAARTAPADEPQAGSTSVAQVSGRLTTPDGRQLLSAAMIMIPIPANRDTPSPSAEDVRIHPDGSFAFLNVPPGQYEIRARGETEPGGRPLLATFRLVIEDHPVTNLQLALGPGADVAGTLHVEADGRRPPAFTGIRVRAPLADGSSFGDAITGDVAAGGSFAIRGLMNGSHLLALEGLPDPWILHSVTYRGQDITDQGLEVEGGQRITGVRITITDVASEVTGSVTNADGAPARGALVVVVPGAQQYWSRASRRLRVVRADPSGRYKVRGLPAGEYVVAASAERQEEDVYRHEVLRELTGRGTPLTLSGLEARVLDLALPASLPSAAASR
jgi:hypothetical protein